jgi:RNA 2',3'-cyclic 3'-phosphodiesterase
MRLFVALELNAKVIQNLTELVRRLRPYAPVKWVHPQNMHVTLKYVGDWQVHRLEELVRALHQVKLPMALNVPLAGLGFFPNARNPRVFWAGAENTPPLRQLASQVDVELQALGIAPEVRPYHPHLTLGRVTENEPLDELYRMIDELPSREFGTISPDRFVLFESTLTAAAPIYRKIAEFSFVTQLGEPPVTAARPMFAGKV